jgi:dihydrofolate synthase / folylpolyglutamate synthase
VTYQEAIDYLYAQLPMFQRIGAAAYKPDLSNTIRLCKALNIPHQNLKCIHIAGTNGKGSTSHLLASVFQEAGYKVGLYTSPHLLDFRERIKINGKPISKKYVSDFTKKNENIFHIIQPSFFEMTVALCFNYFKDKKVDIAIIETGLGGRLDSTNVITPLMSVITNISFDHMHLLGNTLEKIAYEKAGIIKANIPVVIGEQQKETEKVFLTKAKEARAKIDFASKHIKLEAGKILHSNNRNLRSYKVKEGKRHYTVQSELCGAYQVKNIATVIKSIQVFTTAYTEYKISKSHIKNGIKNIVSNTGLLGRWQITGQKPLTICDTAHNEAGISLVIEQIKALKFKSLHFIIGMVNDKDVAKVLSMLPKRAIYYFTKADIPRAMEENELHRIAQTYGLKGKAYSGVKFAYQAAKSQAHSDDLIFIGGSTFTVADFLKLHA